MAVMTNPDRAGVAADYMRGATGVFSGVTKADILAAINAADDWANTNAAAYNLALPLLTRTNLTAVQKARLLMFVIRRRFDVGA